MKSGFKGSIFKTKHTLYFGNETSNPVGYLRSGGTGISYLCNQDPNIQVLHTRPHYILVMLLEDSQAVYRDESGFSCPLVYGDFLFAFPNFKQHYGPGLNDYWAELNIGFTGALFDLYREWGVLHPGQAVWHLDDPLPWITRLQQILEAPRPKTPREIARGTAHFAVFLMDLMENATPKQTAPAPNDWFTRACLMLTNDLSNKTDLHAIAAEVGLNYDAFRLHFTRAAGVSPLKYRNANEFKSPATCWAIPKKVLPKSRFIWAFTMHGTFPHFLKSIPASHRVPIAGRVKSPWLILKNRARQQAGL